MSVPAGTVWRAAGGSPRSAAAPALGGGLLRWLSLPKRSLSSTWGIVRLELKTHLLIFYFLSFFFLSSFLLSSPFFLSSSFFPFSLLSSSFFFHFSCFVFYSCFAFYSCFVFCSYFVFCSCFLSFAPFFFSSIQYLTAGVHVGTSFIFSWEKNKSFLCTL